MQLNRDVLKFIWKFTDPGDIVNYRLCCKSWYILVEEMLPEYLTINIKYLPSDKLSLTQQLVFLTRNKIIPLGRDRETKLVTIYPYYTFLNLLDLVTTNFHSLPYSKITITTPNHNLGFYQSICCPNTTGYLYNVDTSNMTIYQALELNIDTLYSIRINWSRLYDIIIGIKFCNL